MPQKIITDQLGRTITVHFPPRKIVSVVPSQTELLFDLGLEEEVCGITKFCIHPEKWFKVKTKVGGTKTINIEKVKELQPDLIIANKEENNQEQIELLMQDFPVFISDIKTLNDALEMVTQLGSITNTEEKATALVNLITTEFLVIPAANFKPKKVAYLIWKKPYMSVNKDTFIHDMLLRCNLHNVFADEESRYPEITIEKLAAQQPDIVLLSSEPYPFNEQNIKELQQHLGKTTNIILVDGEMFSWYGSRLQYTPKYLLDTFL